MVVTMSYESNDEYNGFHSNLHMKIKKHTTASIRWSSPTQLLISRSEAYLWLSGREAEFSTVCGRVWERHLKESIHSRGGAKVS